MREEMRHELTELTSALGITSVFVTHDQTEAMSMSDRIAVLNGGYVEQYAAPETIYHDPASEFVARFVGKSNWLSETEMFRPEAVAQTPVKGALHFELPVQSVQYLGSTYCRKHSAVPFDSQDYFMQRIPAEPHKETPKLIERLQRLAGGFLHHEA